MSFKVAMTEAASFSQASVYDYQEGKALKAALMIEGARDVSKRNALVNDLKAGAVLFVVVLVGALALMGVGVL